MYDCNYFLSLCVLCALSLSYSLKQKVLILVKPNYFYLLLLLPFAFVAKKVLSNSEPQRFTPLFSSKNCIILTLQLAQVSDSF